MCSKSLLCAIVMSERARVKLIFFSLLFSAFYFIIIIYALVIFIFGIICSLLLISCKVSEHRKLMTSIPKNRFIHPLRVASIQLNFHWHQHTYDSNEKLNSIYLLNYLFVFVFVIRQIKKKM